MTKNNAVHACVRIIKEHQYHWHNKLTLIMVIAGSIRLRVWARDNLMQAGDIIVINKGEVHKLTAETEENLVVLISFSEEFCNKICNGYKESIIVCNSVRYSEFNSTKYVDLKIKVKKILYAYGLEHSIENIRDIAEEIIKYMCYHFDYVSSGINHNRFSDYIIKRNKMLYRKIFLEKSSLNHMNLKELSAYLGINYTYFRTDIIERFGFGFIWLKHTIMTERAARMILTTDERLIDISNKCGFSDQKYFRKYFLKFYECTPSIFRKNYKDINTADAYVEIPLIHIMRFYNSFKELEEL